jgi:hypothetical protein
VFGDFNDIPSCKKIKELIGIATTLYDKFTLFMFQTIVRVRFFCQHIALCIFSSVPKFCDLLLVLEVVDIMFNACIGCVKKEEVEFKFLLDPR